MFRGLPQMSFDNFHSNNGFIINSALQIFLTKTCEIHKFKGNILTQLLSLISSGTLSKLLNFLRMCVTSINLSFF